MTEPDVMSPPLPDPDTGLDQARINAWQRWLTRHQPATTEPPRLPTNPQQQEPS